MPRFTSDKWFVHSLSCLFWSTHFFSSFGAIGELKNIGAWLFLHSFELTHISDNYHEWPRPGGGLTTFTVRLSDKFSLATRVSLPSTPHKPPLSFPVHCFPIPLRRRFTYRLPPRLVLTLGASFFCWSFLRYILSYLHHGSCEFYTTEEITRGIPMDHMLSSSISVCGITHGVMAVLMPKFFTSSCENTCLMQSSSSVLAARSVDSSASSRNATCDAHLCVWSAAEWFPCNYCLIKGLYAFRNTTKWLHSKLYFLEK